MYDTKKSLRDQVIVITGASSGIGLSTARMAARRGAAVVLVARNADVLAKEAARLTARGGRAIHVVADVGSREAVQAVADRAIAAFGGFDSWVNVAGVTIYGNLWDVEDADSQRLMQTNFWGTVYGSLVAVEHLKRNGGALVNVGSVGSDLAFPLQGMYGATKHAVKGFSDALRMELMQARMPVSVTLIKPASIDTPLPQRARNYMKHEPSLPPPIYKPEEVAEAILYACVHPRREIYVGGAAKTLSGLKAGAPGLYDLLAPVISSFERRDAPARAPEGTLHTPAGGGAVRGNAPGFVMPVSIYTRAVMNPLTAALASVSIAVASATLGTASPRQTVLGGGCLDSYRRQAPRPLQAPRPCRRARPC